MKHEDARNQLWVRDSTGRIGLLLRQMNGWDVAYGTETKQSVDLSEYTIADGNVDDRPPVREVKSGDTAGGVGERSRRK